MKGEPDEPVTLALSLSDDRVVVHFREALKTAGITRTRLWSLTETEEPVDFRSLRDTCAIGWRSPKALHQIPGQRPSPS
jgi:hypothetical protein